MAYLDPKEMLTQSLALELDRNKYQLQRAHAEVRQIHDRQKEIIKELISRGMSEHEVDLLITSAS